MSNKRKLSGNEWKKQNAKKLLQSSAGAFRSIQDFMLPAESSPVTAADVLLPSINICNDTVAVEQETVTPGTSSQSFDSQSEPQLPGYYQFVDNSIALNDAGLPLDDIGYAVKIISERTHSLSDSDIYHFLKNRWQPKTKEEFPVSYHNKSGSVRPHSLNMHHLEQFPWLAISRLEKFKGAWCTMCVLFKTTDEGGGRWSDWCRSAHGTSCSHATK